MPWILSLCLLTSSVAGSSNSCEATDLDCVLRLLQQKAIEAESLAKQLEISKEQTRTANELIEVWKAQAFAARDSAKEAMQAIKPMAWYQSPVLWFAVGAAVAVGLTIGLVYALRPAFTVQ